MARSVHASHRMQLSALDRICLSCPLRDCTDDYRVCPRAQAQIQQNREQYDGRATHNLVVKTGEYTDDTGQTRIRWLRIGTVFRHDDGGTSVKLSSGPDSCKKFRFVHNLIRVLPYSCVNRFPVRLDVSIV